MSTTTTEESSEQAQEQSQTQDQQRFPAVPVFGTEIQDATFTYKKSDAEKAPKYTVLPTGQSVNRIITAGALISTEDRNTQAIAEVHTGESENATVRVSASTQFSPGMASHINGLSTPQNVAVVGKFNQFSPDDSDRVYVNVRPEAIGVMSSAERQRWVQYAARETLNRMKTFNDVVAGDSEITEGVELAQDQYALDLDKYRTAAQQAVKNVVVTDK